MNFKWSNSDLSRVIILLVIILLCVALLFSNDYITLSGKYSSLHVGLLGIKSDDGYETFAYYIDQCDKKEKYTNICDSLKNLELAGIILFVLL